MNASVAEARERARVQGMGGATDSEASPIVASEVLAMSRLPNLLRPAVVAAWLAAVSSLAQAGTVDTFDLTDGVKLAYCPMVKASWLQKGDTIRNPYYGSAMLECGEFRKPQ